MDLPFELKLLKKGRPKDDVWQYYLEGECDSQGHASAVYTYCNIKYSRGETSLLKGHLANHCMKAPGNVIRISATSKGKSDIIDKALMRFFICCGVSFRIVKSPFFLDFLQELNSVYNPPSRDILTNRLFEEELGYVNSKVLRELEATKNLTLDLSSNFHTGEFIAEKIEDILIRVGAEKFSAIVSDNGSNVRKARGIIQSKHLYIEDVQYISHCVNLISCDIVKHPFAENLLKKINILANFFRNNAMAGVKLCELIKSMNVKGGGIVPFCKTRWTTAFQSISDIIRLKAVLEELASNYSNILSNEKIKPIIRSWNFFNDLKVLAFILKPLRDTILLLERSSANLSLLSWNGLLEEFDDDNYLLAFFLHPRFRTCLKYGVWQRIVIIAGKVAKNAGMDLECSRILCSQLLMYKNNETNLILMELMIQSNGGQVWN
ncbi:ribonuclease H-like domain-containing protein [Rhizophagus irregularis DAOM 181602=DAOM 197198]|nr:ribonuclease H-like domain-containing protein [Rhizophagus irregularis DAOM 181602=DAOM 197198]